MNKLNLAISVGYQCPCFIYINEGKCFLKLKIQGTEDCKRQCKMLSINRLEILLENKKDCKT